MENLFNGAAKLGKTWALSSMTLLVLGACSSNNSSQRLGKLDGEFGYYDQEISLVGEQEVAQNDKSDKPDQEKTEVSEFENEPEVFLEDLPDTAFAGEATLLAEMDMDMSQSFSSLGNGDPAENIAIANIESQVEGEEDTAIPAYLASGYDTVEVKDKPANYVAPDSAQILIAELEEKIQSQNEALAKEAQVKLDNHYMAKVVQLEQEIAEEEAEIEAIKVAEREAAEEAIRVEAEKVEAARLLALQEAEEAKRIEDEKAEAARLLALQEAEEVKRIVDEKAEVARLLALQEAEEKAKTIIEVLPEVEASRELASEIEDVEQMLDDSEETIDEPSVVAFVLPVDEEEFEAPEELAAQKNLRVIREETEEGLQLESEEVVQIEELETLEVVASQENLKAEDANEGLQLEIDEVTQVEIPLPDGVEFAELSEVENPEQAIEVTGNKEQGQIIDVSVNGLEEGELEVVAKVPASEEIEFAELPEMQELEQIADVSENIEVAILPEMEELDQVVDSSAEGLEVAELSGFEEVEPVAEVVETEAVDVAELPEMGELAGTVKTLTVIYTGEGPLYLESPRSSRSIASIAKTINKRKLSESDSQLNAFYFVRKGDDTWDKISTVIFGDSKESKNLRAWNKDLELNVGQKILYRSQMKPDRRDVAKVLTEDLNMSLDEMFVQRGDTLSSIAYELYGDTKSWKEIYALNPELKSANSLELGQRLRIQPIVISATRQEAVLDAVKNETRKHVGVKLVYSSHISDEGRRPSSDQNLNSEIPKYISPFSDKDTNRGLFPY